MMDLCNYFQLEIVVEDQFCSGVPGIRTRRFAWMQEYVGSQNLVSLNLPNGTHCIIPLVDASVILPFDARST